MKIDKESEKTIKYPHFSMIRALSRSLTLASVKAPVRFAARSTLSPIMARPFSASPVFNDAKIPKRVNDIITKALKNNDVVVFMKGTPGFPQCGFSRFAIQLLDFYGVQYDTLNVLDDDDLRQGIKAYSEWPTIPQVFIQGELIGGADILRQMHESGELKKLLLEKKLVKE